MTSDWQNKEAQMRYTAEYMANEYKNQSANMKYKYNELKKTVKELKVFTNDQNIDFEKLTDSKTYKSKIEYKIISTIILRGVLGSRFPPAEL